MEEGKKKIVVNLESRSEGKKNELGQKTEPFLDQTCGVSINKQYTTVNCSTSNKKNHTNTAKILNTWSMSIKMQTNLLAPLGKMYETPKILFFF